MTNKEDFALWLIDEIEQRGWTSAELASRAHIGKGSLSRILNRERNIGPDVATSIARALHIPPEEVFRKAGLLPEIPYGELDELNLAEMIDLMRNLSPKERRDVLEYARLRYRLSREDRVAGRGGG